MGMSETELRALAVELGEKEFRGKQLADWLYRHGCREIVQMTNLPPGFRSRLEEGYAVGRSQLVKANRSADGTFKVLLRPAFGELVETVGMPYEERFSCCVSTQVGCPVGCVFCATGSSGFKRNLSQGEIVDQALAVGEYAVKEKLLPAGRRVSHVVLMGMGEPLLNYEASVRAIRLLNREVGVGMRSITLSTIGYVPGIYRLANEEMQLTLAVSLHAADDALRSRLVPGMSRYRLQDIMDACRHYFRVTGRRVTLEYCLLKGVNDGEGDASSLAEMLGGLNCHVNLIPYNPVDGARFSVPNESATTAFRRVLEAAGIPVTQREQRGAGIAAACGQLRRREQAGQS